MGRIRRKTTPGDMCGGSTLKVIAGCLAALLAVSVSTGGARGSDLDPLSIVRALMAAESTSNLDAAVALFADDAFIINATGWKTAGKEQLKWFINTEIWLRDSFQLHEARVNGEKIIWYEPAATPFYERIGVATVQFSL